MVLNKELRLSKNRSSQIQRCNFSLIVSIKK
jgi:hypothetical protein